MAGFSSAYRALKSSIFDSRFAHHWDLDYRSWRPAAFWLAFQCEVHPLGQVQPVAGSTVTAHLIEGHTPSYSLPAFSLFIRMGESSIRRPYMSRSARALRIYRSGARIAVQQRKVAGSKQPHGSTNQKLHSTLRSGITSAIRSAANDNPFFGVDDLQSSAFVGNRHEVPLKIGDTSESDTTSFEYFFADGNVFGIRRRLRCQHTG